MKLPLILILVEPLLAVSNRLEGTDSTTFVFCTRRSGSGVNIFWRISVPLRAACLIKCLAALDVDELRNRFKMIRIDTSWPLAEMIYHQVVRDYSLNQLESRTIRHVGKAFTEQVHHTVVMFISKPSPDPTVPDNHKLFWWWLKNIFAIPKNLIPRSLGISALYRAKSSLEAFESSNLTNDRCTAILTFVKLLFSHFASQVGDLGQGRLQRCKRYVGSFHPLYENQETV